MRLPPMTPHRLIKEDPSLGLWGDTMVAPPRGALAQLPEGPHFTGIKNSSETG